MSDQDTQKNPPPEDDDSDAPGDEQVVVDEAPVDPRQRRSERGERPALNRGAIAVILLGAAVPFLIMCSDSHWALSVPLGLIGCAIASAGILALLGSFAVEPDAVALSSPNLGRRLGELAITAIGHIVVLRLAVAGVLPRPIPSAAVLVLGSFLLLVVSVFRTGQALGVWQTDENGERRGLLARHGFWLVALVSALYLPLLGSFSLTDPWETHYGEVAREMLSRDDWISLWWAQDGWFFSKPVLDFWIQGVFFSLLGVRTMPDEMLASVATGRVPGPEWAARMPVFLLTLLGVYLLYKGVAYVFGRRAGFLGALVLTTMPYWYFIAHQSMTDAPYVAPFTGAMGLMMVGLFCDPEARVRQYDVRLGPLRVGLSAYHLLFGAILLSVLPQVLYLLSRNLTLQIDVSPHGFRPHLDEFFSGSGGGNCGLPGNEACRTGIFPVTPVAQPGVMALVWSAIAGLLLWRTRGERRVGRLAFIGAWWLVAVSALAKGAPGLVLPIAVLVVFLGVTKRWRDLERVEFVNLVLLVAVVALPWYVQMHFRHGPQFIDRLLFHDMYKRAFVHVHDTNSGDDTSFRYYVWQLGYGLFPWTGLSAAALAWWLKSDNEFSSKRGAAASFLALWFVLAFAMFTVSLTKFHHYVLPAVPAIGMLTGVMLAEWWRQEAGHPWELVRRCLGATIAALLSIYGALRAFGGSVLGTLENGARREPALWTGILWMLLGVAVWIAAFRSKKPASVEARRDAYDDRIIGSIAIGTAVVTLLVGRDMIGTKQNNPEAAKRLLDLFTYNYKRPWPMSLDFSGILTAFTVVVALVLVLVAVRRSRAQALGLFTAAALVWCAWGLNGYFVRIAPHWGQRETIATYYQLRASNKEPFVAYQMNWKGENFYTGNRVPAFVSSGEKFKKWIEEQKQNGVTVMFVSTEHGRIGGLKSELGRVKKFETVTTKELNNKFILARVEL